MKQTLKKVVLVPLEDIASGKAHANLQEFSTYVQKILPPPIESTTSPPPTSTALTRYRARVGETSNIQTEAIPLPYLTAPTTSSGEFIPTYSGNIQQPSTSRAPNYAPQEEEFPPLPNDEQLMTTDYPPAVARRKRRWDEMQPTDVSLEGGPPAKRVLSVRDRKKSRFLNEPYVDERPSSLLKRKLIGRGIWLH